MICFEVLEGPLGLRVGDEELVARPGDVAVVEPGTPHRFDNPDGPPPGELRPLHRPDTNESTAGRGHRSA